MTQNLVLKKSYWELLWAFQNEGDYEVMAEGVAEFQAAPPIDALLWYTGRVITLVY
jgi:hypothetical protein